MIHRGQAIVNRSFRRSHLTADAAHTAQESHVFDKDGTPGKLRRCLTTENPA